MKRILLLEKRKEEIFCALLEEGKPVEYWRHPQEGDVLYLGRVQNLMPKLEAAFVDIGEQKNAFLPMIEKNLPPPKAGQEVLVQVVRAPGGDKGKRVTRCISLPGRLLTLLAMEPGICAVSGKITEETERQRLLDIAKRRCVPRTGWILRTAARGVEEVELAAEAETLYSRWQNLENRAKAAIAPCRLASAQDNWADVRDLLPLPLDEIIVSEEGLYAELEELLEAAHPSRRPELSRWEEEYGLFSARGVSSAVERAGSRKIWLPCGGQLVFDRCEAMTVVDVNAGKFQGGSGNLEENFLRLNVEAAQEIARQMRLRDIGGIVVIDFVDMKQKGHRDLVWQEMQTACSPDRGRPVLVDLSALCLLQLTRKAVHAPSDTIAGQRKSGPKDTE